MSEGTQSSAQVARGRWLDRLLPADLPADIDRLLDLSFRDGDDSFKLGAADQLIAALVRSIFHMRTSTRHLVIALPRGEHDIAILTGFLAQLLRLQAWEESDGADPLAFSGPVVVIARDTSVQVRLSRVNLRGVTFGGGLADAVSACRVRADGRVVEPDGAVVPYRSGHHRLLYLNSRVGWPDLQVVDGFGVIDRTTLRDPKSYRRALEWSQNRCARTVTIADLNDPETEAICREAGLEPFTWPFTPAALSDLCYVMGTAEGKSKMTANPLLQWSPSITVRHVDKAAVLDEILRSGYASLAATRTVSQGSDTPMRVRMAIRLLALVQSCVVDIDAYGRQVSADPRIRFGSPKSLSQLLQRSGGEFYGAWKGFAATDWANLRGAALRAYTECQAHNPKRDELVAAIDARRRREPSARILVRVPNRAAARLLEEELSEKSLMDGRIGVAAWSDRGRWLRSDVEIWCGIPPWPQRSMLFSGEAQSYEILCYEGEAVAFEQAYRAAVKHVNAQAAETAEWLRVDPPPAQPVQVAHHRPPESGTVAEPQISLGVDFDRIVNAALDQFEEIGEVRKPRESSAADEPMRLLPIELDDGSYWWLSADDAVGTLVHNHYRHRLVSDLRAGDLVVVPRGEGREELFTRLVEAIHQSGDVADLDFMLTRFRKACAKLYAVCGDNWAEAGRRLEAAGASATTQLRQWASGETIAPAEAKDVRIVAKLVQDSDLEQGWKRIAAVAKELRGLHIRLGHVISGALAEAVTGEGENLEKVKAAFATSDLAVSGLEILDEFGVHCISWIGEVRNVPASLHGAVTRDCEV